MDNYNIRHVGEELHDLARELFPICRSLTGDGVRQTLDIIRRELPSLTVHEVSTGTRCGDWTVPDEWNIRDAYILTPDGEKIADFNQCNLHVLGYSEPVDQIMSLEELIPHLYSDPDRPTAIPYRTSYYKRRWGFCLRHSDLLALKPGNYRVRIDSTLAPGAMTYGELILHGESEREVLVSTYICHPSMGNNELSGVVVTAFAAKWLQSLERLAHTYRIVFIPETLGSICYMSRNIEVMATRTVAGFNVTCIGDQRGYSYLQSRAENTLSDRVAEHVLKHIAEDYQIYPFIRSGSDERQYCSPGADLPVVSLMRSKYAEYPEYHSSLDNLEVITPTGLAGGYDYLRRCLECVEGNERLRLTTLGQPQLGKRGLYPSLSTAKLDTWHRRMVDLIAYADGRDLISIAEKLEVPMWQLFDIVATLKQEGILQVEP